MENQVADEVKLRDDSAERVAKEMAHNILFQIEGKTFGDVSRQEYLMAVYQSLRVLRGHMPSG
jgi:hypothetical protein